MLHLKVPSLLLFVLLFFLINTSQLFASTQLIVEKNISSYTDFKVEYYKEPLGNSAGIEKISDMNFTDVIQNSFSFGYEKNNYWFHFTVHNNSEETKDMVLEFTEIIHKVLDLYVISDKVEHIENGLHIPVKERAIKEATPSFPLQFLPYETKELYIHLSSIYGVFGAIHLKTKAQYKKDVQTKKYLYLFYFTAVLTLALYNLIIFLYLREKLYLLYLGHISIFMIWALNYKGILLPYITMETYDLLQITIPTFFALLIFFSQSILETKKYFLFLHKLLNTFIGICIVSFIWMLISIESGFYFMNIAAVPFLPVLFFVAFWALYKNHNIAKLYLVALTVYILGMSLLGLLALGILPYNVVLSYSAIIGSFFEVIFFSLLLAYRINVVRQESLQSQKELIKQKKTESSRLFHTVAQKTMELNKAKAALEEELAKKESLEKHLKHLASTDPMTELMNRRSFFDTCNKVMIESSAKDTELACLIIDIDHFKNINDTYGHDMGDKVIKTIAKLMINNTRTVDFIGRIGGEEFAILMPNTDVESAYQIADRLRDNISKEKMALDGKDIYVTVSIGLSYLTHADKSIHTIIKRADTALYEAKQSGRNQICTA